MDNFSHQPVLLKETVAHLMTRPDGLYVDCTAGGGGHSEAILQFSPQTRVLCIDRDSDALAAAKRRLAPYGDRAVFVWENFSELASVLARQGLCCADGFLFDLGVSSYQLDEAERGFTYQTEAPLDMRMDRERTVTTARDLVNRLPEDELAQIISRYGEERWAARIAKFIVAERREAPLETTGQLVTVIKHAVPKKAREDGPHPAKRTFQALRIAVNDELNIIGPSLSAAAECLCPGGRLAVISFHSLEDRIVKETFRYLASDCVCPPEQIVCTCDKRRSVRPVTRKPIVAGPEELSVNPRARSAKLRVCEKVEAEKDHAQNYR